MSWVPEDMDPAEAAPMLCAGLTAFSKLQCGCCHQVTDRPVDVDALRHMDVSPGELVAIQGIG